MERFFAFANGFVWKYGCNVDVDDKIRIAVESLVTHPYTSACMVIIALM